MTSLTKLYALTHSEAEILVSLKLGLTAEGICQRRDISMTTYRFHTKNIRQKTQQKIKDIKISPMKVDSQIIASQKRVTH